jgi:hypothetical protein
VQKLTGLGRACRCDVSKGLGGYTSAEIQDWKLENRKSKLEKAAPGQSIIDHKEFDVLELRNRAQKTLDMGMGPGLLSALVRPRKQTFTDQRRITTIMSQALELEFVLVSSDYTTMTAVSKGIKKFGARFVLVPTAHDARDCLGRRKVDGVFVDMEVPGAIGLVESIRKGTSNSKAVIFACGASAKQSTLTLNAGANFLLRKPLNEENVMLHLSIAKDLLVREQRRYFRHAVSLPVMLKDGEAELQARMTNLSGGGLAIRSAKPLKHAGVLDFEFELTMGARVSGKGQVAWTNAEGMAGLNIQTLRGKGKEHLEAWLAAKERDSEKGSKPKD